MAERLIRRRPIQCVTGASIRKWALIFLAAGTVGRSIFQNALVGLDSLTTDQLAAAMNASDAVSTYVTIALVCKVLETCAAPLFCFLLVEGFRHTSHFEKYLLRVGALALVCELPYNLAYNGKLLFLGSRNPVFGMFLALVMLYFFSRYDAKAMKNTAMKVLIFVAAFLWANMLRIDQGVCVVILVALLWMARDKSHFRALYAFGGAMACSLFNMYYMGGCLACIFLHRYNDEQGEKDRRLSYAAYPVMLLVIGIAAKFIG